MKQLSSRYVGMTLSDAIMRSEDLIPKFMGILEDVAELCEIQEEVAQLREEVDKLEMEDEEGYRAYYKDSEQASWILNEGIWDLMDSIAPEFCYFGAHEGDGTCYGFWTSDEALGEYIILELETINTDDLLIDYDHIKSVCELILETLDTHNR